MGDLTEPIKSVGELVRSVGVAGLAFVTYALLKGILITKREFDACEKRFDEDLERERERYTADMSRERARADKLDERLERALHIGDRAMDASDKLVEKLAPRN